MGALRRAAPVARPFPKRSLAATPAACGAMVRKSSSTGLVGGDQKLSAPCPKYTKVVRNGIVVEMEVIPVVVCGEVPNSRPIVKPPPRVVETSTCGTMVRETKSARRAGAEERFSLPSPKRTKVTRDGVKTTTSVEPALGTLRKRMAAELDALHAILRKAEHLFSGKNGRFTVAAEPLSEAPAEAAIKTPPEKRAKVSTTIAKVVEFESAGDKDEVVDICGGVSPAVPVEKAGESGNSPGSSSDSGSSSSSDSDSDSSDSGSSSSSDSDSDSDSDNDPDESVDVPVPHVVLPQQNGTSVQPTPEPASEVVKSTEAEKLSTADLIAKAKIRRQLLEMERAVLPDESIHARDLQHLCIDEYGSPSVMQRLGLFIKAGA